MKETGDGGRYAANPYCMGRNFGSLQHSKLQGGRTSYPKHGSGQFRGYDGEDEDMVEVEVEEDYDDDDDEVDEHHGTRQMFNRVGNLDKETDDESDEGEYAAKPSGGSMRNDKDELERHQKKRKLESLLSSYEFAPSTSKQGPNTVDWTDHETFFLLETWGDKFLKRGRKSLLAEEWQEVAEEVSQESKIERTEAQCRNRLDTLRKKYRKEKMKSGSGIASKWLYYRKMDFLMSSPAQRQSLSCGMDSGEYVFMNPKAYLDLANGMDELRDSPSNSESSEGGDDCEKDDGASFRLLADAIDKFGDIYEKIEHGKRQQMVEMENMRMDFQRELEVQKRQILERAEAEITRIRESGDDDNDLSTENLSE